MRPGLAIVLTALLLPLSTAIPLPGEPEARFHDAEVWHPQAVIAGFNYTSTGCAPGGSTWYVKHDVEGLDMDLAYWPAEQECLSLTSRAPPAAYAVGTLGACTIVEDSAGRRGIDDGHVTLALFPSDPSTLDGFPRFDQHEGTFDTEVYAEFIVGSDGSVRGYRWGTDGRVLGDTLMDARSEAGDRLVTIEVGRPLSEAHVHVDGTLVWQGIVRQDGAAWWQLAPVADEDAAAGLLYYEHGVCA